MKFEFILAQRFTFPHAIKGSRRPTFIVLIATVGIAIGTAALIIALTIVQGFSHEIKEKILGFGSHIQVTQITGQLFSTEKTNLDELSKLGDVNAMSPFLHSPVIVKSASLSRFGESLIEPAQLKAIDPKNDVSFIRTKIAEGTFFRQPDSLLNPGVELPILIGKKLAQKLRLELNDELLLIRSDMHELGLVDVHQMSIQDILPKLYIWPAQVVGIYETGLVQGFDESMIFSSLKHAQKTLQDSSLISGYDIQTLNPDGIPKLTQDMNSRLGYPFHARSIFDIYYNIFAWLRLQENIIPMLLVTISIVAGFNVISTLLIMVLDKKKEIGILMSMGLGQQKIRRVFISQSILMAGLGIVLGNLLALGLSMLEKLFHIVAISEEVYFLKQVPILIKPENYVLVSAITLFICIAASYLPSRLSTHLNPVDVIEN